MKLPFTWPNSSDSSSVSGRPAQLTATIGALRARAALVDRVRDELLADAALAGDQHLRVGSRDAVDLLRELRDDAARPDQLFASLVSHMRFLDFTRAKSLQHSRPIIRSWLALLARLPQKILETAPAPLVHRREHRPEPFQRHAGRQRRRCA